MNSITSPNTNTHPTNRAPRSRKVGRGALLIVLLLVTLGAAPFFWGGTDHALLQTIPSGEDLGSQLHSSAYKELDQQQNAYLMSLGNELVAASIARPTRLEQLRDGTTLSLRTHAADMITMPTATNVIILMDYPTSSGTAAPTQRLDAYRDSNGTVLGINYTSHLASRPDQSVEYDAVHGKMYATGFKSLDDAVVAMRALVDTAAQT